MFCNLSIITKINDYKNNKLILNISNFQQLLIKIQQIITFHWNIYLTWLNFFILIDFINVKLIIDYKKINHY